MMGNSTKQWKASYNPSNKKRAIQGAIENHSSFTQNVTLSQHQLTMARSSQSDHLEITPVNNEMPIQTKKVKGDQMTHGGRGPMPFEVHGVLREGHVPATFIPYRKSKKRRANSVACAASWGSNWGGW
jgi:hypothetical protein